MTHGETQKETNRWLRRVSLLVSGILILVSFSHFPVAQASSNIQPQLYAMTTEHPDSLVNVIVQKTAQAAGLESSVSQLGGKVTKDLSIINAFAAQLAARDVPVLARQNGVKWISLDSPVVRDSGIANAGNLVSAYPQAVGASRLWTEAPGNLQGNGIGVAIIDSGVDYNNDYGNRVVANSNFNDAYHHHTNDIYGHGTFVAGIVAGNGSMSNGAYVGIAPSANLINLRVSDDQGQCSESDIVDAMQWVLSNKSQYNIRVVNMSLNSGDAESYMTSPMDAAAEVLWFNGIVMVASAGNNGTANLFAPANDPFVITVGATDDHGTASLLDDTIAAFSAYGMDETGHAKPDLVAPGTNIVSTLPVNPSTTISQDHPANRVDNNYFRMSGTSMSAPIVAGAVALLLQDEPNLTPDQVKYRLKSTAVSNTTQFPAYNSVRAGAGMLNIYAAVHSTTVGSANTGLAASQLLWTGSTPVTWGSVNWNSVNWNSVNWNSVNWNSVNWNSVNWNSDYWGQ